MDFDLPAEDDPQRVAVREWIAAHPEPTDQQLADAGYVVPHWPAPWGLDADPIHQLIIAEELAAAGISLPHNAIGIGWAAPVLWLAGTDAQKQRYLPGIFTDDERWCQLFSEPDAGSDLAGLATRAVRDGDEYVITGSKIWSSGAHTSRFGILLARTDPDVAKHRGISYFVYPMDAPGTTMTPIVDMTTAHSFNHVFFDDVRIPVDMRIGEEGDGWRLAKATLANERVGLSSGGALWGAGPGVSDFLDLIRAKGSIADRVLRQRLARLHSNAEVLRLTQLRTLSAQIAGQTPGPAASIQKVMSDELGGELMELAKDLGGAEGMLEGSGPAGEIATPQRWGPTEINFPRDDGSQFRSVDPIWHYGFLFSPALTLGGGTFAIQRNIIAEYVLGLPREPNLEHGLTWAQTRHDRQER